MLTQICKGDDKHFTENSTYETLKVKLKPYVEKISSTRSNVVNYLERNP